MANSPSTSIITLTTDFGLADHYVGTMKCVISKIWTHAHIVDLTHQIPPADLVTAAYTISQAAPFSPLGAIHVVVVDPGVGTERKPIAVRLDHQTFVAPDNGVLTLVLPDGAPNLGKAEIRQLENPKLWLQPASNTFHGRDLFAPAAAHLASGNIEWEALGPKLDRCILLPDLKPVMDEARGWHGIALSIDHFGNIITNFKNSLLNNDSKSVIITINGRRPIHHFCRTFAEAPPGQPFLYHGSSGYLEIAINRGHTASYLGTRVGDPITLEPGV